MSEYKLYQKNQLQSMRPYVDGEDMSGISISDTDSPVVGGMIAVSASDETDMWYIDPDFFASNYQTPAPQMVVVERETLAFASALTYLIKGGQKIARAGWNGNGMFLFLVNGSTFEVNRAPLNEIYPDGAIVNYLPHIDMRTAHGDIVPWLASQGDLLGNDWYIVEQNEVDEILFDQQIAPPVDQVSGAE